VLPNATDTARVAVTGKVGVTELSGSESSAHFVFGANGWVSLAHGTHPYRLGEDHTFYMNTDACLYFAPDGNRVA
jgi:glycerol transport system ATP-binding protein